MAGAIGEQLLSLSIIITFTFKHCHFHFLSMLWRAGATGDHLITCFHHYAHFHFPYSSLSQDVVHGWWQWPCLIFHHLFIPISVHIFLRARCQCHALNNVTPNIQGGSEKSRKRKRHRAWERERKRRREMVEIHSNRKTRKAK